MSHPGVIGDVPTDPFTIARPILTLVDGDRPPDELTAEELGSRIVGLSGQLASATCAWLLLVARFDARDGCARFGLPSTARWLSYHCGIAHRTAVEHVRVARGLATFPELAEEMSAGRISYSQARAISRVPTDGAEQRVVSDLIELAEHATTGQLETAVRGLRTAEDNEPLNSTDDPVRDEYVRHAWTSGSQWRLNARLDPERGTLIEAALDAMARTERCTIADALVRLAEVALVVLNDSGTVRPMRGDEMAAVVIHIDADEAPAEANHAPSSEARDERDTPRSAERDTPRSAERDGPRSAEPDGPRSAERDGPAQHPHPFGRIANGPGLPSAVTRRLLCSARVRTAVHDGRGNVCDLGRSRRLISTRLFYALLMRDHGECAHPGCTSRSRLQAHHVVHWVDGGRTDLDNLVLLCEAHHVIHHAGGFEIERQSGGTWRFVRFDGRDLVRVQTHELVDPAATRAYPDAQPVAADAATTRWLGERMDQRWAIAVLAERRASVKARRAISSKTNSSKASSLWAVPSPTSSAHNASSHTDTDLPDAG